jgi:hypothetical protein
MARGIEEQMIAGVDREEILRRFEALVDAAMAAEAPPAGLDPEILSSVMEDSADAERQCDAYALWSAVTALTQEIKLQGRSFGELRDTVAMQPGKIAEELRAVRGTRADAATRGGTALPPRSAGGVDRPARSAGARTRIAGVSRVEADCGGAIELVRAAIS